MMVWSINLFILSIGIFIVGMFRPIFILFWMEKPGRLAISFLSVLIFMIAATMYGEAQREIQNFKQDQVQLKKQTNVDKAPTVVIEDANEKN